MSAADSSSVIIAHVFVEYEGIDKTTRRYFVINHKRGCIIISIRITTVGIRHSSATGYIVDGGSARHNITTDGAEVVSLEGDATTVGG